MNLSRKSAARPRASKSCHARRTLLGQAVVLATGGQSYPASGSSGDGYRWAAALGHTIVAPRPALVPITTHAPEVLALQGITLADVRVSVLEPAADPRRPACLAQQRGSLLFAHFGLSGPAVLDVSRAVSGHARPKSLLLRCDLLPEVNQAALEADLREQCRTAGRRLAVGILAERLPQRLAEIIAQRAGFARPPCRGTEQPGMPGLARAAKQFDIPIAGTMGFRKAEVTAGGVVLGEVDPRHAGEQAGAGALFCGRVARLGRSHWRLQFSGGLQHGLAGRGKCLRACEPRSRRSGTPCLTVLGKRSVRHGVPDLRDCTNTLYPACAKAPAANAPAATAVWCLFMFTLRTEWSRSERDAASFPICKSQAGQY